MFCINCFHKTTRVSNSRPRRNDPSVWRRRTCPACDTTFTTIERPSLADNRLVSNPDGTSEPFNLGKLIISVSGAFMHDRNKASYDALWIAQTVENILSTDYAIVTADDIAAVTHQTLKRFDELAAVQYAAKYQLITSTRQRGRPSLSPGERAQRTDASPSQ